jgi:CRP-like cAMP-binding protein
MDQGTQRSFPPGAQIFTEGEPGSEAYFIVSGLVQIWRKHKRGYVNIVELGPGSIFGELALLDGRPRAASATCRERTVCEVITKQRFDRYVTSLEPIAGLMIGSLLGYIRSGMDRIEREGVFERVAEAHGDDYGGLDVERDLPPPRAGRGRRGDRPR